MKTNKTEQERKDLAFTWLLVIIMTIAVFTAVILVQYTKSLQNNSNQLEETINFKEIQEFDEWKASFNPFQQTTINKCLATKDTFRKLYCNIEFSKAYNQTITFP